MTHIKTARPQAGARSHPTPLARLYATALELDITFIDMTGELAADAGDATAAIVAYGTHIALTPHLEGDELRADVLAMALSVSAMMVRTLDHSEGGIVAPAGFVVITRDRVPEPAGPAGKIATLIARQCGRDTASAAFEYYVPVFAGDQA
jgi:hypothetical protein